MILRTLDHTQIQAIDGRPFLTSSNIIPMYIMIEFEHSVRASDDPVFFWIQQISRYNQKRLQDYPEYVHEFRQLCSENLTFIEDWNNELILPSTIRLYSKKIPV